ncbi:MAG: dihydrolipoamide acetyltransferase family protein [Actinomycetota bacterium]
MSVTISMPKLGETVTEGTILAWVKEIGEFVKEDDILVEISTDKVDTEVPSPAEGILTSILVPAGTTVEVGTDICVLGGDAEETSDDRQPTTDEGAATEEAESETPDDQRPTPDDQADRSRRAVISPVVRKLAAEHGIDLAMVPGTGDGGRITRKDVDAFVAATPITDVRQPTSEPAPVAQAPVTESSIVSRTSSVVSPATAGETRDIPHIRSLIAENMVAARQTAAHAWTSVEVDYERVAQVRLANKDAFKAAEGFSLTYLPFIARATMEALAAFPVVNSQFDLEGGAHTFHRQVNMGLAIDLDQKGLVVANIPGTDSMTMRAIARSVRATAEAAHENRLGPDDLHGFTFTITNPGPFGSFMSAPIIPPPNAAIMSTDTVVKRPVVVEMADGSDGIAIHHVGYLGLSWDHRVFDGSTAVLFLRRVKENLETWDWNQELK